MRDTRVNQMKKYIAEQKRVTMEELCEKFGVSMNTVRRDISELLDMGLVRKVYGGVISCDKRTLRQYYDRKAISAEEKRRIGEAAAEIIEDNDVIYADAGTTVFRMIPYIKAKNVTVITASLSVMNEAASRENLRLVILPGTYDPRINAATGAETVVNLQRFHLNKAFISAAGFTVTHGATHASENEYELKRAAITDADQAILMADSTKMGNVTMMKHANPEELDLLITDAMPEEMAAKCKKIGLKVRFC